MLESVLRYSIKSRYLVVILTLAVAAFGAYSLQKLPIDAVPDITNNQIQINTEVHGLSPVEVEKQVTFNIETALAGIPGLKNTRSLSRNAFSQVTAVFEDNVNIYFARQQVGERLAGARESLPPAAEPRMGPISTGLGEVYMWSVNYEHPKGQGAKIQDGLPGWQSNGTYLTAEGEVLRNDIEFAMYLRTVQDWIIAPQVKSVLGVAGVDTIGGYVKQFQVKPSLSKMISYGVSFQDILEAIEKNNLSAGAGFVERYGEAYLLRADGRIENAEQLSNVVISSKDGTPVYIKDVATVQLGKEVRTGSAAEGGEETVIGTALMLIGENSRTVSAAVDSKIKQINRSLPANVVAKAVLNRTTLVDATIKTVRNNLVEGAILVIVILFLMLGNIRAALICATAIPISMLLTSIGMVQTKISGNLMSLGAIDFGLVIDGAVIIVENCLRRLAEKQHELGRTLSLSERLELVFDASKQVRGATAFGEAIIISVYIPILALTGVEGKMFHPMAATVIFALIAAFILSLTFVPAMVAIFVSGEVKEKENFIIKHSLRIYKPFLMTALAHRKLVAKLAVGVFLASLVLFSTLGSEFIPKLDEKNLALHAMRIPSTSLNQSTQMTLILQRIIKKFPEVAFVFSKIGTAEVATDPMPPNVSDNFVVFKPEGEWPKDSGTKKEVVDKIAEALKKLPGNAYEFTQPIEMRFNELIAGVRSDVAVKVYGDDFAKMETTASQIVRVLNGVEGAADVKAEQTKGLPALTIDVKRERLGRYGLSMADAQDAISVAIGGKSAGLVFEGDRRFDIVLRVTDEKTQDPATVERVIVPLNIGEEKHSFVPLGELADISVKDGPNQISRENGKRRIVVQANVRGTDLGSFVENAQQAITEKVTLPPGQWLEWGGQFENLVSARKRLSLVVPLCFLLIIGMLYKAFNSLRYALLVFSGVPLALSGGVLSLWLRGLPFSISAAVGFIALSGVAVLNGLVMVSFINELRQEGTPIDEAIYQGSLQRLRPVLMTALVASLGFVPMAISSGTGAEVQRPLATVVIGGIITSTLLTLVVLPALYRLFAKTEGSYA